MSQDKHETRQETSSSELTDEQLDQISGGVKPNTPIDLCKAPGVEPSGMPMPGGSGMPLSNGDSAGSLGGTAGGSSTSGTTSGKVLFYPPK